MTKPRTKPIPEPEAPSPRWASPRVGATYAGVGLRTLTDKIAKGEIPAYKFGPKLVRVDLNDIDALMVPISSAAADPQPVLRD